MDTLSPSPGDSGGPDHVSSCCQSGHEVLSACCSHAHFSRATESKRSEVFTTDLDVEKGSSTLDRIILDINGLKCGCCDPGLAKAIRHIPPICSFQINLVLSRVEFDLDTSRLSVSQVISQLNKATGFTFVEYKRPEGQVLEVLVNHPRSFGDSGQPLGIISIDYGAKHFRSPSALFNGRETNYPNKNGTAINLYRHSVSIYYDPTQIGARDILEYYQQSAPDQNVEIAPPRHQNIAAGVQQTKNTCLLFLLSLVFTIPVLVFTWGPGDYSRMLYAHISLGLASVVQIIAIWEFVPGATRALFRSGLFDMDFLITLSTTTAYIFSIVSYVFRLEKRPFSNGFFETSTLLVTLILLGRVLNEFALLKATKAVSFRSLQTYEAILVLQGGETRKIDARLLQLGDHFKVPPHTRIVTDGRVIYGGSEVDESVVTGESIPVAKGLGHHVLAGSTNGSGELVVALTALPHDNSISKIAALVESAELSKPKAQAIADKIAGWFVPVIVGITIAVFLGQVFWIKYHSGYRWEVAVVMAFTYAIATLIVSCPCAIALAVPMVVLIAAGVAARYGIIFRDPQKIEIARNATDVIFDKTGTLTVGELSVVSADFYGKDPVPIKKLILGLLGDIKHPVSIAVVKYLKADSSSDMTPTKVVDINSIPGNGVEGSSEPFKLFLRAGNPDWLGVKVLPSPHTVLCFTVSGVLSATFRFQDQVNHNARSVISLLTARGLNVHMISGDNKCTVRDIAHLVGIPRSHVRSRCTPAQKQEYVKDLQEKGSVVIFCGDGTNDSVALKQADVGVHMSHGSDVAQGASDVVLTSSNLQCIPIMLDISRAAYRRILFNFGWSFLYNLVAVLFAAGAFVWGRLPPAWAGLGELVSVLPVVIAALLLSWRDFGKKYKGIKRE
ncbi:heavy metal translocatin [Delitschia confertaspora ATCC 74209]|uniref:Heavy metal translocatin n=1 Tax=Delitschia confertaspora ATCC 74209 TaxID=1513339 RepID=A0A9P4JQZ5_9PLEO|nr:heavy metal translocatin [Delitschia confertaspora ATCC 74209]